MEPEPEQIIERVLDEFRENQDKPITDPSKTVFGPTLPQMIASALREAGLLVDRRQQGRPSRFRAMGKVPGRNIVLACGHPEGPATLHAGEQAAWCPVCEADVEVLKTDE